jgi:hypothetical protein
MKRSSSSQLLLLLLALLLQWQCHVVCFPSSLVENQVFAVDAYDVPS